MDKIKIKFTDFWFGFDPFNNFFYKLLNKKYQVILDDNPDIVIYSCYGTKYLVYTCTRVFYSAENLRPDFSGCDFAITFDFNKSAYHYRLPLYALYIDQNKLLQQKNREELLKNWRKKNKFCCMVVSNGTSKKRVDFFKKLSAYKKVDSGGKYLNNVGGPISDKLDFIKDYRFVISFENAAYPGYTTEKIVEPLITGCIPLYWGNPLVAKDFNLNCFLNLSDEKNEEDFIKEIIAIDNDEEKALQILMAPVFSNNIIPSFIDEKNLLNFFLSILEFSKKGQPIATTFKGTVHKVNIKAQYCISLMFGISNRLLSDLKKLFVKLSNPQ